MQTNTQNCQSRTVVFSNKNGKFDPYVVVGGHFVGDDGFVVPRDFTEFGQRFPTYVRRWVVNHSGAGASREDVEDWTQDLTIHLMSLPAQSQFRSAGKTDVVQTFDPKRHYGANAARFWNFINLCLTNKFRTMHSRRMKEPLCRPGTVSLDALGSDCFDDPPYRFKGLAESVPVQRRGKGLTERTARNRVDSRGAQAGETGNRSFLNTKLRPNAP